MLVTCCSYFRNNLLRVIGLALGTLITPARITATVDLKYSRCHMLNFKNILSLTKVIRIQDSLFRNRTQILTQNQLQMKEFENYSW